MLDGYAYTTAKKVYIILGEYFRYLTQQEILIKNPMSSAPMIKKANYLAAQDKENLPTNETVTVFTLEEIEIFKEEAFRCWSNGKRIYQQAAAYILMLNTGIRTGELLGILNNDVDLEKKTIYTERRKRDFKEGRCENRVGQRD